MDPMEATEHTRHADHSVNHAPGAHVRPSFWRSRAGIAWLVFGAIAAFFAWTEHRAHLLGALPLLLVLACPLMHLFMHGGHGHGHGAEDSPKGGRHD